MRDIFVHHPVLLLATVSIMIGATACSQSKDNGTILPGNRIAIMQAESRINADETLKDVALTLGEARLIPAWAQTASNASGLSAAIAFPASSEANLYESSTTIGDGTEWTSAVAPAPVTYGDRLFAMDASGTVGAHRLNDIDELVWKNTTLVPEEERATLGGGLAANETTLFAVTGMGHVGAFSSKDGKLIWDVALNVPVRSAPRLVGNQLFLLSIDNQLFSMNTKSGFVQWVHQGIATNSGYVSNATVAVSETNNSLIVPHSSGDVFALEQRTGRPIWNDNIGKVQRTRASSLFGGIHASPVIVDDIAYAIASDGLMIAARVQDGRIIWQRELSSLHTPAIAGDTAFVLATNGQLIALHRFDGRVRWVSDVSHKEEDDDLSIADGWHAPIVVNERIWLMHRDGIWLLVDALNGTVQERRELDEGIASTPIFAGDTMAIIYQDARIHTYRAR